MQMSLNNVISFFLPFPKIGVFRNSVSDILFLELSTPLELTTALKAEHCCSEL